MTLSPSSHGSTGSAEMLPYHLLGYRVTLKHTKKRDLWWPCRWGATCLQCDKATYPVNHIDVEVGTANVNEKLLTRTSKGRGVLRCLLSP